MRRIDELRSVAEVFQNPLNHCGFLDAGDHPQLPATAAAGLDVNGEHPLEALRLRREACNKVLRLEDHVRGAIAIGPLQCIAYVPALGQR